ncbi:MAG TPA: 4-alpha-glucanotransferase, partial [Thermoanaerobaculia bacterium]|nr:4-alpha-glucanotransferase [Thermoanaerobaculia bacterium]
MNRENDLQELAHLYGIETAYQDAMGQRREAAPEALLAILAALDAPVEGMVDVGEALGARREEFAERLLEPVVVAWEGGPLALDLRLGREDGSSLACHVDLEDGGRRGWAFEPAALPLAADGSRRLTLPERLPPGYHQIRLATARRAAEAMVISAPRRAFGAEGEPIWGVFLPLYALHTRRSWGAGDLSDLETLSRWTSSLGGGVVATLPLLAAFLDEPCEPSPYAPASRLFWNELYLDPRSLPELAESPAAQRLVESPEFRREIEGLRARPLVDYRELMFAKRRVFEEMAHRFFSRPSRRREELDRFVLDNPEVETYAAFRAVGDRRGEAWPRWPERLREGSLAPADYEEEDRRYHLWVQWATAEQMRSLALEARRQGPGLYLDLPLGVGGASFDVWREQAIFARGASAGAPPDAFFTKGQSWGFPPLSPERLREHGYGYLVASLRHHLEHAGILRIDHVMQLHRLFWIPEGMGARDGVYVRYPAEELYAILSLESHRHRAVIVGENLGTVPPEVSEGMDRHGILGMYVVQYELQPGNEGHLREPPAASVASLNTHDMPTFRAFWEGRDADVLASLGFYDAEETRNEKERRRALRQGLASLLPPAQRSEEETEKAVLHDRLAWLARSPARMVLVNLEDLWQESEPQNVPGTHTERPNWQRKAKLSFEELSTRPDVVEPL